MTDFVWDKANSSHLARHNIGEGEAEEVIRNLPLDLAFEIVDNEERLTQVGATVSGRILVIVNTWQEDAIRVITGWEAPAAMKSTYLQYRLRTYGN